MSAVTYNIKPNGGGDGISIGAIQSAINTSLAAGNAVTLNCYKGGDIVGATVADIFTQGSFAVCLHSTSASASLTINFIDLPSPALKNVNNSTTAGKQLCTFASGILILRVRTITVNSYFLKQVALIIESNPTPSDVDVFDTPITGTGGTATVTATLSNSVCWSGSFEFNAQAATSNLTATLKNVALTDGPLSFSTAVGSTLSLVMDHVGSYGGDAGLVGSADDASTTVNLTLTNSIFCGRGICGSGSSLGTATIHSTITNCLPATFGGTITALDSTLVGVPFVNDPQPPSDAGGVSGVATGDLRPLATGPLVKAGASSSNDLDFIGNSRLGIDSYSIGPIEPFYQQLPQTTVLRARSVRYGFRFLEHGTTFGTAQGPFTAVRGGWNEIR